MSKTLDKNGNKAVRWQAARLQPKAKQAGSTKDKKPKRSV